MPAFMKLGNIKGEAASAYAKLKLDGSIQPYPGGPALVERVRRAHSGGANYILIGLMPVPGYKITTTSDGIIAILIGLLLPAVQKMAGAASADLQLLSPALAGNGSLGFAMADGSVRPAFGAALGVMNKNCQEFESVMKKNCQEFEAIRV